MNIPNSAEELFSEILDKTPAEQAAFLAQACRDQPELRRRVEWLLEQHQQAGSFLQGPAFQPDGTATSTRAPEPAARFAAGQTIHGRFLIVRFLARGGMGEVYEAQDLLLPGTSVALKIIRPEIAADAAIVARFQQEVVLARKVVHPNLCPIYEIFRCEEPAPAFLFLSMRLLRGKTLYARLREGKRLEPEEAVSICRQLASGVAALHGAGILHRDLKPNNIMLEGEGADVHASIMDFGLARLLEAEHTVAGTGMIAGTPGFLAPEILRGGRPTAATDLYALGMVFAEVLTGERPALSGTGLAATSAAALRASKAPAGLVRATEGLLSAEPEFRTKAFAELTKAGFAQTGEPVPAGGRAGRSPGRIALLVAAVVLVAAAVAISVLLWPRPTPKPAASEARVIKPFGWAPALSRDGKMFAYAAILGGGPQHIWVQQTAGHEGIPVTSGPDPQESPDFSPDGTHIVFYSAGKASGVYIAPTLPGEAKLLASTAEVTVPRYSPRGDSVLYWQDLKLYTVSPNGGPVKSLPLNENFDVFGSAHWSPDGNEILFYGKRRPEQAQKWWIASLNAPTAREVQIPAGDADALQAWVRTADREWIIYSTQDADTWKMWRVPITARGTATKEQELVATGSGDLQPNASVSEDGKLAYSIWKVQAAIFQSSLNRRGEKDGPNVQLALPESREYSCPSLSHDGKWLAFVAVSKGKPSVIVRRDTVTGTEHVVDETGRPDNFNNSEVSISTDGRLVAFDRNGKFPRFPDNTQEPLPAVFLEKEGGGPIEQLCERCSPRGFSADNSTLLIQDYDVADFHKDRIKALDLRSKTSREFLSDPQMALYAAYFSWDDRWVAFKRLRTSDGLADLFIAPVNHGVAAQQKDWIAVNDGQTTDDHPQFSADGNTLYFTSTRDGYVCIWAQRLDPATKRPLGKPFGFEHFHNAEGRAAAYWPAFPTLTVAKDKMLISLPHIDASVWMTQMQ